MVYLRLCQVICSAFPPIISQSIRNRIFPLKKARELGIDFYKTSITGSIFYGNTSDDHSYRFLIHGFFDWRNIIIANRLIKYDEGDIIEIGANVGTETISYCDLASPKWKVHAFEPLPENVLSLENLSQNLQNLIVYPKAISNENAVVHFQLPPKHQSGIGKIVDENISGQLEENKLIEVNALPLNSYVDTFKKVSLISIDTEGHEPYVLNGSEEIIKKFRPAVIIEVSPKLLRKFANSSTLEIYKFFISKNYSCYIINRLSLEKVKDDSMFSTSAQNWLCVPDEKEKVITAIKKDLKVRALVPWYFLKSLKNKS